MTFIANSQHNMQGILDKANEFYCINDIDINHKKSELIVINANAETTQKVVKLGRLKTEVKALEKGKAARFLGVWITAQDIYKQCLHKLKKEIYTFISIVRNKKIKYLNNKVLLSRLEYRANLCLIDKKTCDKIH